MTNINIMLKRFIKEIITKPKFKIKKPPHRIVIDKKEKRLFKNL